MHKTSYLEQVSRKSEQYHAKYGHRPWKANAFFWFWNLVQLVRFQRPMRPLKDGVCRVGFHLKGGLGDILVSLNYLKNLHRFLGGALAFDVYVSDKRDFLETIRTLCREQDFVKQVLPKFQLRHDYDLFVELVRFPAILHCNESKISELFPELHRWCLAVDKFHRDHPVVFRYSTHGDYIGLKLVMLHGHNRLQQADVADLIHVESAFCPKVLADAQETLAKFSLHGKRFITLQRGVGGGDRNVSTKLWPMEHYETLVALIREKVPDICIVQIGTQKNLPIRGVDMDLRDKTSFEDVMVFMRESSCHIDGECGLVHLRHFLAGGASIVLFGPTDEKFFAYPENVNMNSGICPGGCEWITASYTSRCARGFEENECLVKLSPETVLPRVLEVLDASSKNSLQERESAIPALPCRA